MVISFEEKDRAEIEAMGITVVEFKKVLYKAVEYICDAANKVAEVIIDVFQKTFSFVEDVIPKLEASLNSVLDWYQNIPEPERHKIVKLYAKANKPAMTVSGRRVYHCRDKC